MKRSIAITALSISIGLSTSVGVTEVCANKFDQEWAKKVLDIKSWNAKHPEYVKAHNLTRDMSRQTASMKRAMKALEVMCAVGLASVEASDHLNDGDFGSIWNSRSDYPLELSGSNDLSLDGSPVLPLIATGPYPDYPSFNRPLESEIGLYPTGGGWFAGGGYVPVGYPTQPVGPGGPGTGIVPTPETSTFGLVAFGAAFLMVWRKR